MNLTPDIIEIGGADYGRRRWGRNEEVVVGVGLLPSTQVSDLCRIGGALLLSNDD